MSISLYIHIPFCAKKCPYCGFYKEIHKTNLENNYIQALVKDIQSYRPKKLSLKSIFFGGGTPTLLSKDSFDTIFKAIHSTFILDKECEITVEANPETISETLLDNLLSFGVNRLSLGVQSTNQNELDYLGRWHKKDDILNALSLIKKSPFVNVNLDLIFGTKIGSIDTLKQSLSDILSCSPTHISTYALSIEPNTLYEKRKVSPLESDVELQHYTLIQEILNQKGYAQYEVSAFAKPGFESIHNLSYWTYEDFIGVGPSANSFFKGCRYTQPSDLETYINSPIISVTEKTSLADQRSEYIMSNLRLLKGFKLDHYKKRFKSSFTDDFKNEINLYIALGLLHITEKTCKITSKGLPVLNELLMDFIYDA